MADAVAKFECLQRIEMSHAVDCRLCLLHEAGAKPVVFDIVENRQRLDLIMDGACCDVGVRRHYGLRTLG